jgi:SSS family solute:Na+ symporter
MLSTSLTVDLYRGFLNPAATEKSLLLVGRATSIGAGALGILLAIRVPSIITSLTLFYSLVSVALFVPVVVGLYSKRPDAVSALAAIGISVPTTLYLYYEVGNQILGILNPFAIGIGISYVVMWSVTLIRKTKPQP